MYNFTRFSIEENKQGLKDIQQYMNDIDEAFDELEKDIPINRKEDFLILRQHMHRLRNRSIDYGWKECYQFFVEKMKVYFPYILRNIFATEKDIKKTEEFIDNSKQWALIQIYSEALGEGKKSTELAKTYGTQINYWTKLQKTKVFKSIKNMHRVIDNFKVEPDNAKRIFEDGVTDYGQDYKKSNTSKQSEENFDNLKNMHVSTRDKDRENILKENSQDWAIAINYEKLMGLEEAIEYLKSTGLSEKSIEKFRRK